ncbi:MAG: DUF2335 domain-containing protein [Pirellulales bacterium]
MTCTPLLRSTNHNTSMSKGKRRREPASPHLPATRPQRESHETRIQQIRTSFAGPLPPPEVLGQYDQVSPGAAGRIIAMAEGQATHRQALEARAVEAQVEEQKAQRTETKRGQLCGLAIGVAAIVGGTVAASLGAEVAGSVIGGSGLTGLVSIFVLGRVHRDKRKPESPATHS